MRLKSFCLGIKYLRDFLCTDYLRQEKFLILKPIEVHVKRNCMITINLLCMPSRCMDLLDTWTCFCSGEPQPVSEVKVMDLKIF